ncbi:MAG: (d)CMP kinase [Eubacteriales bacterium]|nr:(d)CMP kinase [Eubacteriales bacterium]
MKYFTIAIDGPGGAGKSTVADDLARRLKVPHLDTGAMYRAFAYQMFAEGLTVRDVQAVEALTRRVKIDVRFSQGKQITCVNGKDVTGLIRTPEISMAASDCATLGAVRKLMVALQQKIASRQSMILDGRDIGTRVLPEATLKVYLTASSETRARRRYEEMAAKGAQADYETVLQDVIVRDRQDSTRAIDPLRAAQDAVTLDTDGMTREQVAERILSLLEARLAGNRRGAKPRERLSFLYRLAMVLSAFVFRVIFPVRYRGLDNTELDAPYILIGNHNHMLDPFLVGWKIKRYQIRYLGKKELIRNPLARLMYRNLRIIPVERHKTDIAAMRACLQTLAQGHVLGIFPEGTRFKKTLMEELESGVAMIALRGDVPLLPVYISQRPRLFKRIECYYGKPFAVSDIAQKGTNREACEEVLAKITLLYRDMAHMYAPNAKASQP